MMIGRRHWSANGFHVAVVYLAIKWLDPLYIRAPWIFDISSPRIIVMLHTLSSAIMPDLYILGKNVRWLKLLN
jgi:hypothetical protein